MTSMLARVLPVFAMVVALLAGNALCGSAAGPHPVVLVDVTGEVGVLRKGAAKPVEASVGMELFPGDTVTATASAEVTLFDDGTGTTRVALGPDQPSLVVGVPPATAQTTAKPGLLARVATSLSDMFGTSDDAKSRDREVGSVQATAILARFKEDAAHRARASDKELDRFEAKGENGVAAPVAPGPAPEPGPQSLQDEAQRTKPKAAARSEQDAGADADLSDSLSVSKDPTAHTRGGAADGARGAEPGGASGAGGEGAAQPVPAASPQPVPAPPAPKGESATALAARRPATPPVGAIQPELRALRSVAGKKQESSPDFISRLATVHVSQTLGRVRRIATSGDAPGAGDVAGTARLEREDGTPVTSLDEKLPDGTRLKLTVESTAGHRWTLNLEVAPVADVKPVAAAGKELSTSMEHGDVVAARLMEARGFVFAAYAVQTRALAKLAGKPAATVRIPAQDAIRLALLVGDFAAATELRAKYPKAGQ